ncbi:radical S-adenosyl methionine domain-containing protein 1, mitochondrial isoform X1 [Elephas maximus indicus]|uniref:radical S-adenosyl methionine domain-containing protein 1, mitochondrial isoform X1 n=1 Tax=Elephas maximus indicus TaxID=99487 RepID=UPI0021165B09|nr:radical S-adenosyl methionine domain-containing protein 1, mitochondrial isoform X1 [Elephas maximus indicus]
MGHGTHRVLKGTDGVCPTPAPEEDRQEVAVRTPVSSRWRRRPEAPGSPGTSSSKGRCPRVTQPFLLPLSALVAHLARLAELFVSWARLGLGFLLAAPNAMTLPRFRPRGWVAATKAAQRRHQAEAAGGPRGPAPRSQRAALYVHVSVGGGARGTRPWRSRAQVAAYDPVNSRVVFSRPQMSGRTARSAAVTATSTSTSPAAWTRRRSGAVWVESVFFGGGTPSLASPHTVAAVLEAVAQATHLPTDAEVTLEANPTSSPGTRLAAFGTAGVNRLSIGLQSLDDAELRLLGRTHSASDALRTLAEARHLFPGRVSVDLMLGLPAQQVGPWLGQLQELLCHCDDHISLYQLSLERGTALFAQVHQGALPAPDPELAAEMYQKGRAVLQEAGFRQYEVSNFARKGALSTHNWNYWQCGQYLGVGPGAHGRFLPQGTRGHTREARIQTLEPDNWMKEVKLFGHGTRKRVPLGELELLEEVLAMGLRTDLGITHQHWEEFEPQLTLWDVFGTSKEVKELLEQGLLLLDHRGLRCSWEGLAVLDSLLLTLLPQLQEAWQQRTRALVPGG